MEMTIKEFNKKLNITKEIVLDGETNVKFNGIVYSILQDKEKGLITLKKV